MFFCRRGTRRLAGALPLLPEMAAGWLLALGLAAQAVAQQQQPTLVSTPLGPVRGLSTADVIDGHAGVRGDGVETFFGVPYAEPPVGPLRFMPAVAKTPWKDTIDARAYGHQCLQKSPLLGAEDCLLLNIWRPSGTAAQGSLPVMVWIHGGSFDSGTGGSLETPANPFDGSKLAAQVLTPHRFLIHPSPRPRLILTSSSPHPHAHRILSGCDRSRD